MTSSHSPTSASTADRWLNCPGSVALISGLPPEPPKKPSYLRYREQGQAAHTVAAMALNTGRDAYDFVNPERPLFRPSDAEAVQHYLDYVLVRRALLKERYDRVELRVEVLVGHPRGDFRGTVDAYLLAAEDRIAVYAEMFDYKHGTGVVVPARENKQLMYYAHGLQKIHPEVSLFSLVIVQPRIVGYERPDTWTIKSSALSNWANQVLYPGIKATKKKGAPLKAGSWCRFCPANEQCSVFTDAGGKASLPPLFKKETTQATKDRWAAVDSACFSLAAGV